MKKLFNKWIIVYPVFCKISLKNIIVERKKDMEDFKTFLKWFRTTNVYDTEMSRKERDKVQIDSKTYSCMYYIGLRLKANHPVHKILLDLPDDLKYLMKEAVKLHFNRNKKLIIDWADANYELTEALIHNSKINDNQYFFYHAPYLK